MTKIKELNEPKLSTNIIRLNESSGGNTTLYVPNELQIRQKIIHENESTNSTKVE